MGTNKTYTKNNQVRSGKPIKEKNGETFPEDSKFLIFKESYCWEILFGILAAETEYLILKVYDPGGETRERERGPVFNVGFRTLYIVFPDIGELI